MASFTAAAVPALIGLVSGLASHHIGGRKQHDKHRKGTINKFFRLPFGSQVAMFFQ